MNAPHLSRCDQLGVCQLHRSCGTHRACEDQGREQVSLSITGARFSYDDVARRMNAHLSAAAAVESEDVPPVSAQGCINACGILLTVLALLVAFAVGTTAGSALLHSFDADLRQAALWAWEQLARLYWAGVHISG